MPLAAFSLEPVGLYHAEARVARTLPEKRTIVLPTPADGIPAPGLVEGAVFTSDAAADIYVECSAGGDCSDQAERIEAFAVQHAEELRGMSASDAAALYFSRKDGNGI